MNDDTDKPLNPVGDAALEARLTAWVLGEASPFEAAELEELCARDPEARLFERRLRVLHGVITEDRKAGPDEEWKLPPEKRAKIEALFEGPVVLTDEDRDSEKGGVRYVRKPMSRRHTGRRALLALAACTVVSLSGWALMSSVGRSSKETLAMQAEADFSAKVASRQARERALEELRKAVIAQEDAVEDKRKLLSQIIRTEGMIYSGDKSALQGSRGFDMDDGVESAAEAYTQVEQDKIQLESQIETLLKYDGPQLTNYAAGLNLPDNIVPVLKPKLDEARREYEALKGQGVAENDPDLKAKATLVQGMEKDVAESVSNLRETLKAKLALSNEQLARLKTRMDTKEEDAIKSGIAAQGFVDAKGDFEASQRLLEQLKIKLISEEMNAKFSEDAIAQNEPASPVSPLAPMAKSRESASPVATPAPAAEPAPPVDSLAAFKAKSERGQAADESLARLADGGTARSKSTASGPPVKKPVTAYSHLSQHTPFTTKPALETEARQDMALPDAVALAPVTPAITGAKASKELAERGETESLAAARDGKPAAGNAGGPEWFGRASTATPSGEASDLQARFRRDAPASAAKGRIGGIYYSDDAVAPLGGPAAGRRPMESSLAGDKGDRFAGEAAADTPAQPTSRPATPTADQAFASGGAVGVGQSRNNTEFINEIAGMTIPGIPADPSKDVADIVTAGNRSGLGAVNRNNIDAILNNPDRSDTSATPGIDALTGLFGSDEVGRISSGLDANAIAGGFKNDLSLGGNGAVTGSPTVIDSEPSLRFESGVTGQATMLDLAKTPEEAERLGKVPHFEMNLRLGSERSDLGANAAETKLQIDGALNANATDQEAFKRWLTENEATKSLSDAQDSKNSKSYGNGLSGLAQNEMIRRQNAAASSDMLRDGGREAYSKGDYKAAVDNYKAALDALPDAPMVQDRRSYLTQLLADGSSALGEQYRKVGKYEEALQLASEALALNPNNGEAKRLQEYIEDPIRTNPALNFEHTQNTDEVRRKLYIAEGNYNLGKFDDAHKTYEDVLRIDPYNKAARRGMESVAAARSDYYRAAYDQTRAQLLAEVDSAWEMSVPPLKEETPENSQEAVGAKEEASYNKTRADLLADVDRAWELALPPLKEGAAEKSEDDSEPGEKTEAAQEEKPKEAPVVELKAETLTAAEPFSTFSLHVSDASFKLAKAALDRGEVPAPDGIRPEEFYNAFDYGDPAPATGEPVVCAIEQSAHPALPQRNLLRIGVRTGSQGRGGSTPLNLTLLLDSSGSMEREDRNAGLANAVQQLSGLLKAGDTVSVIGFARQPRLLVDRLPGSRAQELNAIFAQTPPEGGTNLEEGIKLAEQLALRQFNPAAQNRIVLFTDGAANLGDAKPETLQAKVEQMRQNGIAFDAAGFGTDGLNDKLLERLTRNGNGRYYIVDRAEDADANFARQLAGAFRPAAENVKVQVRFNPARVAKYKLIGFEEHRLKKEDFRNDAVDAAEMAAEEAGNALYQIEALPQGEGEVGEVSVRFRDVASGQMVERTWTIPYEAQAPAFDQAAPSIQLAGLAAFAAEKLRAAPLADAVDFQKLAPVLAKVKARYGSSKPVAELESMIGKLK